jgi:hypothetical protein
MCAPDACLLDAAATGHRMPKRRPDSLDERASAILVTSAYPGYKILESKWFFGG